METFILETEQICGRKSMSLLGALQSQANKFVNRFHEERKTKLRYYYHVHSVHFFPPFLYKIQLYLKEETSLIGQLKALTVVFLFNYRHCVIKITLSWLLKMELGCLFP